jgi:hypothetical protein
MQQPLTAPNVSGANSQPTPEVAASNGAATTPAPVQSAPADQTAQQPQAAAQPQVQPQVQPQLQPQAIQPAQ